MAQTCTWQGDGGTDTNWGTANNWHGSSTDHVKPANGDDVVFSNAVNCVVNESTAFLKSLDMTGYTGTLSQDTTGRSISIIGANDTAVVCKIAGTITWAGALNLNPNNAGTDINLTTNGKTLNAITINGLGEVFFLNATTVSGTSGAVTLTEGTLHTDGADDLQGLTHSWGKFSSTGTGSVRTLTLGNSTINITGSGTAWDTATNSANLTLNANTSTINFTYTGTSTLAMQQGNKTLNVVNFTGFTGLAYLPNGYTCIIGTLTVTPGAVKTAKFGFSRHMTLTISTAFTLTGNSVINRLLVQQEDGSGQLGYTAIIATSAGCTLNWSNVDFREIHLNNADTDPYDARAITGGSGDCGGNTGITFTTADDWYFFETTNTGTANVYNWSEHENWWTLTGGAGGGGTQSPTPPLPQDNCFFDVNSSDGTCTVDQDMPRMCKTLDFTGVAAMNFHMNNISQTLYGGIILVSNVTKTAGSSVNFESMDRSGIYLLTSAGKTWNDAAINFNMVGGGLTFVGNFSTNNVVSLNFGTLDLATNDPNFTCGTFTSNVSTTRRIDMGDGTWTMSGSAGGTIWNLATTTSLTFNANSSTIVISSTDTGAKSFSGGALSYNNLSITGGGTGVVNIVGGNTFLGTFTINAPKTVKFTAGTDNVVASLVATGDAGNLIHIDSTSASAATLSDTTGTNTVHYCHIGETGAVNAEGGASWDATDNCQVNTSTGWTTTTGQYMSCMRYW